MNNIRRTRGYTLIELVVAVGLFALVMTLASGAYLLMIDLNRQAQSISTGIDSLSFALETMTRSIRTGTNYSYKGNCRSGAIGNDCPGGSTGFSFTDSNGVNVSFDQVGTTIVKNDTLPLTDPSVTISSLTFYVTGTGTITDGDYLQPHVTITVSGSVASGPRKAPQPFTIETGSTMRGIDITATRQL